jgi:CHAT domain-containing protein
MNALVALGGASFNSEPLAPSAEDKADVDAASSSPELVASILRGGAWERGFAPLTYTGLEAREVAAIHGEVFEDGGASVVLEKRRASRASLEELAPRARWLHIATHGWFAAESIHSWKDAEPLDPDAAAIPRTSGEEQVKGMSPMLLCGLALAGANLPESALGRVPGLVTAEELSTLDLSNCELAVLSACDTNVGERRAGQGVASLQMALQMAGARSVVTSLWKVPDEATRELMTDFYRRLWVEKKPKAQALWEAKKKLREAQDERGESRYALRDWAAWVLTGEPD